MSEMISVIPRYFEHGDARGSIAGLINTGVWREINLISSDAGVTRGGHYHKNTEECFAILSGQVRVLLEKRDEHGEWLREEHLFTAGDVFIVHPWVVHTFVVTEKSQWINMLSTPIDQNQPDFYKYSNEGSHE